MQPNWREVFPERMDRKKVKIKTKADLKDLNNLIIFAREIGAQDGMAIKTKEIVTSEVMRLKCRIPTCWGYNSSFSCPPNSPDSLQMKKIIDEYEWALLLNVPPPETGFSEYHKTFEHMNKMKEIIGRTEVEAQYTGYINAMGFTGGPCTICGVFGPEWIEAKITGKNVSACPLFKKEVPFCMHYNHCRPSARAVGIDMYATAKNAGWEGRLFPPPPVISERIDWPCLPGIYPILIA